MQGAGRAAPAAASLPPAPALLQRLERLCAPCSFPVSEAFRAVAFVRAQGGVLGSFDNC